MWVYERSGTGIGLQLANVGQIANKKYKESIDQAEKMEKVVTLIGAASEILKG